jgi:hypothetical protein
LRNEASTLQAITATRASTSETWCAETQEEQAKKRLRDLIQQGLASGPGRPRAKADDKELLAIARGEID